MIFYTQDLQHKEVWEEIYEQWCHELGALSRMTHGLDDPKLISERGHVALWASSIVGCYPQRGVGLVERKVDRKADENSKVIKGLMDLWLALDDNHNCPGFDYRIEAKCKRLSCNRYSNARTESVFKHCMIEQESAKRVKISSGFSSGAVFGTFYAKVGASIDRGQYEESMWSHFVELNKIHGFSVLFVTRWFNAGTFVPVKEEETLGVYGLFLIKEVTP